MIYLFSGKDNFESYFASKKEILELNKKTGFDIKTLEAPEITDIQNFLDQLEGIGMFSESFVLYLKRLTANKKLETFFVENFERLSNYEIVIWEDDKVDARSKLFKLVTDKGLIHTFEELKPRDVQRWFESKLKEHQIQLNSSQIAFIIERIQNKWVLSQEIEKIKLFLQNKKDKKISDSEIETFLGLDAAGDIWKFLDNFGRRNSESTLKEYNKLTKFEDNTQYLIAMISRELNLISKVSFCLSNDIRPESLKMHPFVLSKTLEKAKKFSIADLKRFSQKLFDLDLAIKKGEIDEKLGLTLYLSVI